MIGGLLGLWVIWVIYRMGAEKVLTENDPDWLRKPTFLQFLLPALIISLLSSNKKN